LRLPPGRVLLKDETLSDSNSANHTTVYVLVGAIRFREGSQPMRTAMGPTKVWKYVKRRGD